jgi:hypothetical protein
MRVALSELPREAEEERPNAALEPFREARFAELERRLSECRGSSPAEKDEDMAARSIAELGRCAARPLPGAQVRDMAEGSGSWGTEEDEDGDGLEEAEAGRLDEGPRRELDTRRWARVGAGRRSAGRVAARGSAGGGPELRTGGVAARRFMEETLADRPSAYDP